MRTYDETGAAQRQATGSVRDARKRLSHVTPMNRVWRERPVGAIFGEVLRVAKLFRPPEV
jgi:hypothetical protein